MGPGCDVNQIRLIARIKGVRFGEIVQGPIDLFKVPGVSKIDLMGHHFGFGRNVPDIFGDAYLKRFKGFLIQQVKPTHQQVFMLAYGNTGPPAFPAGGVFAHIKNRAEQTDDNRFIDIYFLLYIKLSNSYLMCRRLSRHP